MGRFETILQSLTNSLIPEESIKTDVAVSVDNRVFIGLTVSLVTIFIAYFGIRKILQ